MKLIKLVGFIHVIGGMVSLFTAAKFVYITPNIKDYFISLMPLVIYFILTGFCGFFLIKQRKAAILIAIILNLMTAPIIISDSFRYEVQSPISIFYKQLSVQRETGNDDVINKTLQNKMGIRFGTTFVLRTSKDRHLTGYGVNLASLTYVFFLLIGLARFNTLERSPRSPMSARQRLRG